MAINSPGYYDLFDPTKKYFAVLALAGMVEQSREDNEIQSILAYELKKLGDLFFKNGAILSGGGVAPGTTTGQMKLAAARVWINGRVHEVPAATLTGFTGTGIETIGIRVTESVETYTDDNTLLDPAIGAGNYGQPGAHRLKILTEWVRNGADVVKVYEFNNGVQQTQPLVGEIDLVTKTLARRTEDESGNYVVSGFDISVEANNETELTVRLSNTTDRTSGSKAYVRGYEIIKPAAVTRAIPKALDTRLVQDQRFFYGPSNPAAPTTNERRFELPSQPAASIVKVMATYDVDRDINNHSLNSFDELIQGDETLINVLKVYLGGTPAGGNSTVYTKSTNGQAGPGAYYVSGNGIRWDVTSGTAEPTSGASYKAYILVRKEMPVEDYEIYTDSNTGKTYLEIKAGATKPYAKNLVDATNQTSDVDVDYRYYLARTDVIYLDQNGNLGVKSGQSDKRPSVPVAPGGTLALGHINLKAGAGASGASVVAYDVKRLTQLEMRKLLNRLSRAEYNQAATDLNTDGLKRAGNAVANLKGILTEAFAYTAEDIEKDGVDGISRVKFVRSLTSERMVNPRDRELSLPEYEISHTLVPTAPTAGDQDGYTLALASTPTVTMLQQLVATGSIQINQFDYAAQLAGPAPSRKRPTLEISPKLVTERETDTVVINTFNPTSAEAVLKSFMADRTKFLDSTKAQANQQGAVATLPTYMKQQWIWLQGMNFNANEYVEIKFDGRPVRLTPSTGQAGPNPFAAAVSPPSTVSGTPNGSSIYPATSQVITNVDGEFSVAIEIPAGIPSGTVNVIADPADGVTASATFQSNPSLQFKETSISELLRTIEPVLPPAAPKLVSVSVETTGGTPITNLSASTTVNFKITWSETGGMPDTITLSTSGLNRQTQTRRKLQFDQIDLARRWIVIQETNVNAAFGWDVQMQNAGGNVVATGEVRYNAAPPVITKPTFGSISVLPVVGRMGHDGGVGNLSWEGLTAGCTRLVMKTTAEAYRGVNAETFQDNPGTSGQSSRLKLWPGNNRICVIAESPSGNSVPYSAVIYVDYNVGTGTNAQNKTLSTGGALKALPGVDPLAQVFKAEASQYIDGVWLYFAQKETVDNTATVQVQLRDTDNGYPGGPGDVVGNGTVSKKQADIVVTGDGANYFKFPSPVYVEGGREYCFVVKTASPNYKLFFAELGATIISGGSGRLMNQAYSAGVLLESSNDSTWNPRQGADLKFRLIAARYQSRTTVTFQSVSGTNLIGLYLAAEAFLPSDASGSASTSVRWEFQINGSNSWLPLEPESYIDFPSTATSVQVRAHLAGNRGDAITPVILKDGLSLKTLRRDLTGTYITKTATYAETYRYVRMIAKMDVPAGATVRWYVSDNRTLDVGQPAGVAWTEITAAGESKTLQADGVFFEHERNLDLGAASPRTNFRFRFDLSVSSAANLVRPPRVRDVITICNA
jgi:hypothetical protein